MFFQRIGYLVAFQLLLIFTDVAHGQVTITSLPATASIHEDATVETSLHTITATSGSGDPITCSKANTVPASYPFSVRLNTTTSSYEVYSDGSPGFDHSASSSYSIDVDCTDGTNSATGTLTVTITPNSAPVYNNLINSTNVSTTTPVGTTVFTVLTTDTEGDTLNYSMTCNPTPCPFVIFDSGAVHLNEDISLLTTPTFTLSISVADPRNTVGPTDLTITITDINTAVDLSNLPHSSALSVNENTALGTSIFNVTYTDPDTSKTITFTMTSSPVEGLSYFNIGSTSGELTTANNILNFESLGATTFTFTVIVTDSLTTDNDTIVVNIDNVNEAPSFGATAYSLTGNEGTTGDSLGTPLFGITDPDSGDNYTLSMDCGANGAYFLIENSGEVKYQSNYDIDTGSLSSTVVCNVTATDASGLTDSVPLTIKIENINDNTPIFVPAAYSFFVDYYAISSTAVGTVTATDGDTGSFGTIIYTIDQSSLTGDYFAISNTGVISLVVSPVGINSSLYGSSVTITAYANDTGGLVANASVVISISQTTTTQSTTTTTQFLEFLDDPSNWAWLVPCCMLMVASFVAAIYMAYTCKGRHSCEKVMTELRRHWRRNKKLRQWYPRIRKQPEVVEPKPEPRPEPKVVEPPVVTRVFAQPRVFERPGPGTDLNFWRMQWDH